MRWPLVTRTTNRVMFKEAQINKLTAKLQLIIIQTKITAAKTVLLTPMARTLIKGVFLQTSL